MNTSQTFWFCWTSISCSRTIPQKNHQLASPRHRGQAHEQWPDWVWNTWNLLAFPISLSFRRRQKERLNCRFQTWLFCYQCRCLLDRNGQLRTRKMLSQAEKKPGDWQNNDMSLKRREMFETICICLLVSPMPHFTSLLIAETRYIFFTWDLRVSWLLENHPRSVDCQNHH